MAYMLTNPRQIGLKKGEMLPHIGKTAAGAAGGMLLESVLATSADSLAVKVLGEGVGSTVLSHSVAVAASIAASQFIPDDAARTGAQAGAVAAAVSPLLLVGINAVRKLIGLEQVSSLAGYPDWMREGSGRPAMSGLYLERKKRMGANYGKEADSPVMIGDRDMPSQYEKSALGSVNPEYVLG